MLSVIKKHKSLIIFTSFIGIISSFFAVLAALMLANLLNVVLEGNIPNLIKQTLILIGVWGITILLEYLTKLMIGKSIQKMNSTLRSKIVDNLTLMGYEKFHSNDTGSYVSWLTNDLTQIENTAFNNFFTLITESSTVVFALLGLFYINYRIFLLAIVLCLFMLIIPKLLNKKVQDYSKITSEKQEEFVKSSKENLMGHEVFYSYNLLSNFSKNILKNSKILEKSKYKFRKIRALNNSLIIFSTICAQIVMMFLAGYLSIKGITLIGSVIAATDLSGTFFRSFSMVLYCITEVKSANPIFEKFKTTANTNKSLKDCPKFKNSIEIKNLNFSYDNKDIFLNLSLSFEKDKKYAIIGKSGSGKTTLIKLILGHLKNYNGEIYIDNENIKNYSDKSIRDNLSYISQNIYVFNESIKNNITLGEAFDENTLNIALQKSSLSDFVSSLDNNINTIITENGKNISGGQKQRIAIARSLIRNKPILIIDEGTSALDKKNSLEVESNLLSQDNLTVILITHHLNPDLLNKFDEIIDLDAIK